MNDISEAFEPFWRKGEFWISFAIGMISILVSVLTFIQAKRAKIAALQAATKVKLQTITIELTEIIQKLDKLDKDISFSTARDILTENNRRIRRLLAPLKENNEFQKNIQEIYKTLEKAKVDLEQVRPYEKEREIKEISSTVYYAIQADLSELSGQLAEISGLFESITIKEK